MTGQIKEPAAVLLREECSRPFFRIAVTLAETNFAQAVSDRWIASGDDLRMSAGWSCYCWLLGNRPDGESSASKIDDMLDQVENTIHASPDRTKSAMNTFISTVGVSYLLLHDKAVETAKAVGPVEIGRGKVKNAFRSPPKTFKSL